MGETCPLVPFARMLLTPLSTTAPRSRPSIFYFKGYEVAEGMGDDTGDFTGQISVIRPLFVEKLRDFVPRILAPENLATKRVLGEEVTCKALFDYIKVYVAEFGQGSLPTVSNPCTEYGVFSAWHSVPRYIAQSTELHCAIDRTLWYSRHALLSAPHSRLPPSRAVSPLLTATQLPRAFVLHRARVWLRRLQPYSTPPLKSTTETLKSKRSKCLTKRWLN